MVQGRFRPFSLLDRIRMSSTAAWLTNSMSDLMSIGLLVVVT
jgi:hypothetical protein